MLIERWRAQRAEFNVPTWANIAVCQPCRESAFVDISVLLSLPKQRKIRHKPSPRKNFIEQLKGIAQMNAD